MPDSMTNDRAQFRFRFPPAETQVAFGLAAALLVLLVVQGEDLTYGPLFLLIGLFVGGVWAERTWVVWLMIGVIVYLKYFNIVNSFAIDLRRLRFPDLFSAFTVMLLFATCFRFLESARYLNTYFPNTKIGKRDADVRFEFPSLFGGRWWAIPLAIFLALLLLGALPFERSPFLAQFRIQPVPSRLIFMTLFLFFMWFVGGSLLSIVLRWRMKVNEADIRCRSLIAKEMWKDTFDFERRRSKQRSKVQRDS